MSASDLPPFDIRFFGSIGQTGVFDRRNGRLIFGGKPLALLAYLLDRKERPVHRAELLELFWEGASGEAARHSLSHALWLIRKTLGVSTGSVRGKVVLTPLLKSDASLFLEAAKGPTPTDAVWLYQGRFLDLDSYDKWGLISQWIDSEQRRYEQLFRRLCAEGIRIAEARRDSALLQKMAAHARRVDLTASAEDEQESGQRWSGNEGRTPEFENSQSRQLMPARTRKVSIALTEEAHLNPAAFLREITRSLLEQPGALGTAPDHYNRLKAFSHCASGVSVSALLLVSVVELFRAIASEQPFSIVLMKARPPVSAVEDVLAALLANEGIDIAWVIDSHACTKEINREITPSRVGQRLYTPPPVQEVSNLRKSATWVLLGALSLVIAIYKAMNDPQEIGTRDTRATSGIIDELLLPVRQGDSTSWLVVRIDESVDRTTGAPTIVKPTIANRETAPPDLQQATERIGRTGWLGYRPVRSSGSTDLSLASYNNDTATALATHPEDDVAPSYLGGRDSVVFLSRRESENQNTDVWLASFDGAIVERLTTTIVNEYRPKGSPNGNKVAYLRTSRRLDSMQVCVRDLTETNEHCRTLEGAASESNVHWSGDSALLIDSQSIKISRLLRIDAALRRVTEVHRGGIGYMLNASGQYVSFVSRISTPELIILRLRDHREIARVAEWRGHGTEAVWRALPVGLTPVFDSLPAMVSLRVGDTLAPPSERLPIPSSALRYKNSNQSVAKVISSHRIVGLAPGATLISVSANGKELYAFNLKISQRANVVQRVYHFSDSIGSPWKISPATARFEAWKPEVRPAKAAEVRPVDVTFTSSSDQLQGLTGVAANFRIPYSKAGRVTVGVAIYAQSFEYSATLKRVLQAHELPVCSLTLTNSDVASRSGWEYRIGAGLIGLRQEGSFAKQISLEVRLDEDGKCNGYSNGRRVLYEQANRPAQAKILAKVALRATDRSVFLDSVRTTQSESADSGQPSPSRGRIGDTQRREKYGSAGK